MINTTSNYYDADILCTWKVINGGKFGALDLRIYIEGNTYSQYIEVQRK